MKYCPRLFVTLFLIIYLLIGSAPQIYANANDPQATGDPTRCKGTIISFNVPKEFIPIAPWPTSGRDGSCVTPHWIVMHTTQTGETTADQIYRDFSSPATNNNGGATTFVIGKAGDTIQMGETLDSVIDYMAGVEGYGGQISIELTDSNVYNSRNDVPPTQYNAALGLVRSLMKQYNIPLGPNDYNWTDTAYPLGGNPALPDGIYGHYQLNPQVKTDPGQGFMRDFRQDLANGAGYQQNQNYMATSGCVVTQIGSPLHGPTPPTGCQLSGTGTNDLVTYTTNLANALIKACPPGNTSSTGHVTFYDYGCQNTLRQSKGGTFEDKVIDQYQRMPLQCIMFIYGITLHFNKPMELHNAVDEAHAQQYYDYIPASQGIANLRPGDFIVFYDNSGGGPGHIIEVTSVDNSAKTFSFIDANWDFNGSIMKHTVPFTSSYGIISMSGWLRMK